MGQWATSRPIKRPMGSPASKPMGSFFSTPSSKTAGDRGSDPWPSPPTSDFPRFDPLLRLDWLKKTAMENVHNLRGNKVRIFAGLLLLWLCFMVATPRLAISPRYHVFADKRNFFGVPNTLNVITNFPFLVVGVVGLVLSLHGNYLGISVRGEVWGWIFFYMGIAGTAFGSAYYHLKPEDARIPWDQLPMMMAITSAVSCFISERMDGKTGVTSLFSFLLIVLFSIAYERTFNDMRLYMIIHIAPFVTIPVLALLFPPKYTLSRYWFWAIGFYVLANILTLADKKIYGVTRYVVSGHSLGHLSFSIVAITLTVMLWFRNIKMTRCRMQCEVDPQNVGISGICVGLQFILFVILSNYDSWFLVNYPDEEQGQFRAVKARYKF